MKKASTSSIRKDRSFYLATKIWTHTIEFIGDSATVSDSPDHNTLFTTGEYYSVEKEGVIVNIFLAHAHADLLAQNIGGTVVKHDAAAEVETFSNEVEGYFDATVVSGEDEEKLYAAQDEGNPTGAYLYRIKKVEGPDEPTSPLHIVCGGHFFAVHFFRYMKTEEPAGLFATYAEARQFLIDSNRTGRIVANLIRQRNDNSYYVHKSVHLAYNDKRYFFDSDGDCFVLEPTLLCDTNSENDYPTLYDLENYCSHFNIFFPEGCDDVVTSEFFHDQGLALSRTYTVELDGKRFHKQVTRSEDSIFVEEDQQVFEPLPPERTEHIYLVPAVKSHPVEYYGEAATVGSNLSGTVVRTTGGYYTVEANGERFVYLSEARAEALAKTHNTTYTYHNAPNELPAIENDPDEYYQVSFHGTEMTVKASVESDLRNIDDHNIISGNRFFTVTDIHYCNPIAIFYDYESAKHFLIDARRSGHIEVCTIEGFKHITKENICLVDFRFLFDEWGNCLVTDLAGLCGEYSQIINEGNEIDEIENIFNWNHERRAQVESTGEHDWKSECPAFFILLKNHPLYLAHNCREQLISATSLLTDNGLGLSNANTFTYKGVLYHRLVHHTYHTSTIYLDDSKPSEN